MVFAKWQREWCHRKASSIHINNCSKYQCITLVIMSITHAPRSLLIRLIMQPYHSLSILNTLVYQLTLVFFDITSWFRVTIEMASDVDSAENSVAKKGVVDHTHKRGEIFGFSLSARARFSIQLEPLNYEITETFVSVSVLPEIVIFKLSYGICLCRLT